MMRVREEQTCPERKHSSARDGGGGRLQVHVVEDDCGRLPTELEGAAGDALSAEGSDAAARRPWNR